MSSRLFQSVREKHGLAYAISSFVSLYDDAGAIQIMAGLDRTRSAKAVALITTETRRLAATLLSKAEFARAREYVLGCLKLSLETARSHMSWIGAGSLRDQLQTPAEVVAQIQAVTREDVQALAASLFVPDNTTLTLVMPREGVAEPQAHLDAALS